TNRSEPSRCLTVRSRFCINVTASCCSMAPPVPEPYQHLGPVHNYHGAATGAIFVQDKALRAPCSSTTQASDNAGLRKNGPVPSGCAQNAARRRDSSFIWNHQTSLLAPCLAAFWAAARRRGNCEQALIREVVQRAQTLFAAGRIVIAGHPVLH